MRVVPPADPHADAGGDEPPGVDAPTQPATGRSAADSLSGDSFVVEPPAAPWLPPPEPTLPTKVDGGFGGYVDRAQQKHADAGAGAVPVSTAARLPAPDPGLSGCHSSLDNSDREPVGETPRSPALAAADVDTALKGLPPSAQVQVLLSRLHELQERSTRFRTENSRLRVETDSLREQLRACDSSAAEGRDQHALQNAIRQTERMLSAERQGHAARRAENAELRARLDMLTGLENSHRDAQDEVRVGELRAELQEQHDEDMQDIQEYYEDRLQELRQRLDQSERELSREREYTESLESARTQQPGSARPGDPAAYPSAGRVSRRHRGVPRDADADGADGALVVSGERHGRVRRRKHRRQSERGDCEVCSCAVA